MKKLDFIVSRTVTEIEGYPCVSTYSERELIRCKNCKHWRTEADSNDGKFPCNNVLTFTSPDWFCADGEKLNG